MGLNILDFEIVLVEVGIERDERVDLFFGDGLKVENIIIKDENIQKRESLL
jgi:hypothetical protein